MSAKSLTNKGFLADFQARHEHFTNRRFCFILGAGASVQSGIPSGKELVAKWLGELHVREDTGGMPIEEWAAADNLGITGFQYDKAASFYPQVFKRRFQEDPELGYAFLEKAMTDKEPSYG
jgi:protein O-mannosyl-transferase